ncbi:MAG TPA: hypothetical protein VGG56_07520 [Terracidiphilus sp.]|jgi:uncharacterized membrane protein
MVYAVSMSLLSLTIVVFFGLARGSYASFGTAQVVLRVLVALPLLVSGVLLHFFHARVTAGIIPSVFPARLFLAVFTGICEVAGAIGLFVPRVRRAAAFWISIMMVAIFPANIYSAGKVIEGFRFPGMHVRLAMQVVYILFVLLAGYGLPRRASRR